MADLAIGKREFGKRVYQQPDWAAPPRVNAMMTTRLGGTSTGPFSSFNLGTNVEDQPESVMQNRKQLIADLELPSEPLWLNQVHSNKVVSAKAGQSVAADAVYTDDNDVVLVIQVADCLPVLVCNRAGTEIAAIHAGWKGLSSGIIANTIGMFADRELIAWIGPGIGPCHYEVDEELVQAFADYPDAIMKGRDADHWQLNLAAIANDQLEQAGIGVVAVSCDCTYCEQDRFYSYRRDENCGRMAALIWINPDTRADLH